jgi:glycosyltransferase involved in cell wall biosynthesis
MRICILTSAALPPQEGMGYYITNLSKELIRKGHKITVITRGSWHVSQRERIDGMIVWKTPFIPVYPFHVHFHGVFVNRLIRKLISEFDILNVHTPLPPPPITTLPIVTTVHTPMKADCRSIPLADFFTLLIKAQAPFSYQIERKLLALSGLITAVAHSVAEELSEYGLDPAKVFLVGNGVDHKLFLPSKKEPSSPPYILYVGRLAPRKGLLDLIQCAKLVFKRRSDINFIIAGKGSMEPSLRRAILQSGLAEKVSLIGHVGGKDRGELVKLYQDATLVVNSAHYEGLATTLLEAMACGKAVVATAVSGALDVISSGKNGLLVPPKSPERMAESILSILDNKGLIAQLGQAARVTIEEKYTLDIISDNFLKCYRQLIQTHR